MDVTARVDDAMQAILDATAQRLPPTVEHLVTAASRP